MINIAVLSDVHGNLPALQAVLDDLVRFQPDQYIFAGDLLRGPYPNEVIHQLRALNAGMILGNDDDHVLRYLGNQAPDAWRMNKQFGVIRWTAERLSQENLIFLKSLPEQRGIAVSDVEAIRIVHGSPINPSQPLVPKQDIALLDRVLAMIHEPVLVCGHTHQQWCLRRQGKLALNPGAVAGTQIGPRAQYALMIWDGAQWHVELKTVPYDLTPLKEAFEKRGLLEAGGPMARGFLLSMETGYDFMMAFLQYAYRLAEQAGYPDCQVIPDDVWEQANNTFNWERRT